MNRRDYLGITASGLALTLAGCSDESGNSNGNDGSGGSGGTETPTAEDYIEFVDHHFEPSPVGTNIYLYATVENTSDREIRMIEVTCELYIDNERVEDTTTRIHDLGSGTEQTVENTRINISRPDEITNYNITVGVGLDDSIVDYEQTYEFEEFEIQR